MSTRLVKIAETDAPQRPAWAQTVMDFAVRDKRRCQHLDDNPDQVRYWTTDRCWRCASCRTEDVVSVKTDGCTPCARRIGPAPQLVRVGWDDKIVDAQVCEQCLCVVLADVGGGRGDSQPPGQ